MRSDEIIDQVFEIAISEPSGWRTLDEEAVEANFDEISWRPGERRFESVIDRMVTDCP